MNSYLDYPVCNRGANLFSAKAGYHNLNHGYMSSNSCATSESYAPDGRLVAAASAPHQTPSLPLHHQTHVNLDLQFSTPGNSMYGSPLDYGHHQYGLQASSEPDRNFIHAQVSPLGTNMHHGPYGGDSCGGGGGPGAAAPAPGGQYLHFGSTGGEQRQQEYPESVYTSRLPAQSKEKDLEHVEDASKTFDWMKVKRNPPKTAPLVPSCLFLHHSSISLRSGPVRVRGSGSAQRDPHQLHHQAADGAGEGVPLQQVPDAGAEGGGRRQSGAQRDAGEDLVPEPQDEAEEAREAGLRPAGLRQQRPGTGTGTGTGGEAAPRA